MHINWTRENRWAVFTRPSVFQYLFLFNPLLQEPFLELSHKLPHVQNEIFLVLYASLRCVLAQVGFFELVESLDSEEGFGLVDEPFGVGFVDLSESVPVEEFDVDWVLVFFAEDVVQHFFGGDGGFFENFPESFCYNDRLFIGVDVTEIHDHSQCNGEVFLEVVEYRGLVLLVWRMLWLLCIIVSPVTLAMLTLALYVKKLIFTDSLSYGFENTLLFFFIRCQELAYV